MASIVAIEFTDTDCKLAVTDSGKGGRLIVRTLASFPLPKPDDAAVRVNERAQLLRDTLKAKRVKAQSAAIVIPKNFVMARTVKLPATSNEEIAGMARFEAERHIPFNAERHIVSHHTLARQGMEGSDVLLAAVDNPIAKEYLDVCVKAGLRVISISVSSLSVFNAFASAERSAMADRVVAVVNVGRSATDLVIANNGIVNFTRGSTLGVQKLFNELAEAEPDRAMDLADLHNIDALEPHLYFRGASAAPLNTAEMYDPLMAEGTNDPDTDFTVIPPPSAAVAPENKGAAVFTSWMIRLLQEVKRTYEFAHREFNCPMIDHIYLCGEGTLIQNMAQYFRVNFGVEASVFDPFRGAEIAGKAAKEAADQAPAFAAAIGAAISNVPHAVHVNLLPNEYLEQRSAKQQQRSYITTGILALIALGMGYFFMANEFERNRIILEELVDKNKQDKARVSDLSAKKERLRIIRENVQDDQGVLDILQRLSTLELIPEKAVLTRFEYKKADSVIAEGDSKDLPSANQIINTLAETGYFEKSELTKSDNKPLRGRGAELVTGWGARWIFPKKEEKKVPVKAASAPADLDESEADQ